MANYVLLQRAGSFMEAEVIISMLKAHGYDVFLPDQHMLSMRPELAQVLGGARILIAEDQFEEASKLLRKAQSGLTLVADELVDETTETDEMLPPKSAWRVRDIVIVGMVLLAIALAVIWER